MKIIHYFPTACNIIPTMGLKALYRLTFFLELHDHTLRNSLLFARSKLLPSSFVMLNKLYNTVCYHIIFLNQIVFMKSILNLKYCIIIIDYIISRSGLLERRSL